MNSASLKYKSFFYSLAIHLALGIIVLSVYLNKEDEHDVYCLVDLKSMKICTPDIAEPLVKESIKPKKSSQVKKQSKIKREPKKHVQKITKPIVKPVIAKKTIPLQSEPVQEVVLVDKEIIEPTKELEKEFELENEVQEELVAQEEPVLEKESTPVLAVSEPKVSYEAQYIQDNIALINALIKKNLSYPRLAKKRGLQGKAMISFTLNMEGEVLDIEALGVLSSILKKSAIKTVKKASSSFPRPSQVLALRIPIVYKLH